MIRPKIRIRVLGLKVERFKEWVQVVHGEGLRVPWGLLFLDLVKGMLGVRKIPFRVYYARLRKCYDCPIYDPFRRKCRSIYNPSLGCGCYVPYKCMVKNGCWAWEKSDGLKMPKIGWGPFPENRKQ